MLKIHKIIAKALSKQLSAEECAELKTMVDKSGDLKQKNGMGQLYECLP